jgi:hypothetical protein
LREGEGREKERERDSYLIRLPPVMDGSLSMFVNTIPAIHALAWCSNSIHSHRDSHPRDALLWLLFAHIVNSLFEETVFFGCPSCLHRGRFGKPFAPSPKALTLCSIGDILRDLLPVDLLGFRVMKEFHRCSKPFILECQEREGQRDRETGSQSVGERERDRDRETGRERERQRVSE